mmetsp:Transcript_42273/g.111800  ORF Transcript_42273/g.111800 Transcript_42273/m.111800 type:complete len:266 (+) Transcript_42273:225-1022(+)
MRGGHESLDEVIVHLLKRRTCKRLALLLLRLRVLIFAALQIHRPIGDGALGQGPEQPERRRDGLGLLLVELGRQHGLDRGQLVLHGQAFPGAGNLGLADGLEELVVDDGPHLLPLQRGLPLGVEALLRVQVHVGEGGDGARHLGRDHLQRGQVADNGLQSNSSVASPQVGVLLLNQLLLRLLVRGACAVGLLHLLLQILLRPGVGLGDLLLETCLQHVVDFLESLLDDLPGLGRLLGLGARIAQLECGENLGSIDADVSAKRVQA